MEDALPEKVEQACLKFELMLLLELGVNMWKIHRNIYKEHLDYLKTYIQQPYKYSMVEYTNQMKNLFEYKKYLQSSSTRGQSALDANWYKQNEVVP